MQDKNIQLLKFIQVSLCYYTNTESSNLFTFLSTWVCTMQKVEDIAEFGFKIAEKFKTIFEPVTNFDFYDGPDAKATCQWISNFSLDKPYAQDK